MSAETASAATPPARPSAQERAWLQEERAVAKKYLCKPQAIPADQ